jgi:hypothetical protein
LGACATASSGTLSIDGQGLHGPYNVSMSPSWSVGCIANVKKEADGWHVAYFMSSAGSGRRSAGQTAWSNTETVRLSLRGTGQEIVLTKSDCTLFNVTASVDAKGDVHTRIELECKTAASEHVSGKLWSDACTTPN